MARSLIVVLLAAALGLLGAAALAQIQPSPTSKTAVEPMFKLEGAFQTGLWYKFVPGSRLDLFVTNHTGRTLPDIEVWAGFLNDRRALQEVATYWTQTEIPPDQSAGPLFSRLQHVPTASFYSLVYWEGSGPIRIPAQTIGFSMVEPRATSLTHETAEFSLTFRMRPEQIGFTLFNKTSSPMRVIWDECAFIDQAGRSHRVIHEGIRFIERDRPMAPAIVPPGAQLVDLFYPASYITWTGREWQQQRLYSPTASTPFTLGLFITLISEVKGEALHIASKHSPTGPLRSRPCLDSRGLTVGGPQRRPLYCALQARRTA